MKKSKLLIPLAGIAALGATVAPLVTLSSCKENPTMVTVTFDYGLETEPVDVAKGGLVSKPTDPTYKGLTFIGWYTDRSFTTEFDFEKTKVEKSITLFACWGIKDVVGVSLDTSKVKKNYYQGQALDLSDLIVHVQLDGGDVVDLDAWACECTPYDGQALYNAGTQTVTVAVDDTHKATFDVNVDILAFDLEITKTPFGNAGMIPVGTTITRDDFTVRVKDTTTEGKWRTLSNLEYDCNILPTIISSYTFDKPGETEITITYQNETRKLTPYAFYNNTYEFNIPMEITLPRRDSGVSPSFETTKKLAVMNGDQEVEEDFTYDITYSDPQNKCIDIDDDGYIVTKHSGFALVTVKDEDGVAINDPIRINVVDYQGTANDIQVDGATNVASYPIYVTDANGVCVIPDQVMINSSRHDIQLTTPSAAITALDLYLPGKLDSISGSWIFQQTAPTLNRVYYDGTATDFEDLSKTTFLEAPYLAGVQCRDEFVGLSNYHSKAQLTYDATNKLVLESTATPDSTTQGVAIQIDLSEYYMGPLTTGPAFAPIKIIGWLGAILPDEFAVYADGVQQYDISEAGHAEDGTYHLEEVSGVQTLTWKNYSKIAGKNIVIKINNWTAKGTKISSVCNIVPSGIRVTARHQTVGVPFKKIRNDYFWTFADGQEIKLPDEYVTAYITTNIEEGKTWTAPAKGLVLEVTDTNFGFTAKDNFNVLAA